MRRTALSLLVVIAVAASAVPQAPAAAAARRVAPVTLLVAATVSDAAKGTMPQALWQRLVSEYANASKVVPFAGAAATREDCRAANAAYLITAVFDLAPRLPGTAQDTDRKYATAKIELLNCVTGAPVATRALRLESDPLSRANEGDFESNVETTWVRSVRDRLSRDPLPLTGVARILRIDGSFVYVDGANSSLAVNQALRDFADKNAQPRAVIDLVVTAITGRLVQAVYNSAAAGGAAPHIGDYVEPAVAPAPAPAPSGR
ncbi:MAG: hypothetical protein ABR591_03660 [Candidatus Velthaea sp.]